MKRATRDIFSDNEKVCSVCVIAAVGHNVFMAHLAQHQHFILKDLLVINSLEGRWLPLSRGIDIFCAINLPEISPAKILFALPIKAGKLLGSKGIPSRFRLEQQLTRAGSVSIKGNRKVSFNE